MVRIIILFKPLNFRLLDSRLLSGLAPLTYPALDVVFPFALPVKLHLLQHLHILHHLEEMPPLSHHLYRQA